MSFLDTTQTLIAIIIICSVVIVVLFSMRFKKRKEEEVHDPLADLIKPITHRKSLRRPINTNDDNDDDDEDVTSKKLDLILQVQKNLMDDIQQTNRRITTIENNPRTSTTRNSNNNLEDLLIQTIENNLENSKVSFELKPKEKSIRIGNTEFEVTGTIQIGNNKAEHIPPKKDTIIKEEPKYKKQEPSEEETFVSE